MALIKLQRLSYMARGLKKFYGEPRLPWNNLLLVNNHTLKLSTLPMRSISVKITPLFKITIYPHPNTSHPLLRSSKFIVLIGSHYWKNCLRKKQTSIHREPILKCIRAWSHMLPAKSIINIALMPTSVLVSSEEVVSHLHFLFQKKIILDRKRTYLDDDNRSYKSKSAAEFFNCFDRLFPFHYHRWMEFMVKRGIFKNFSNFYSTYTADTKINSRGMWIMAHHYKIYNSKDLNNLFVDVSSFLKMLKKFNFFDFFNERIISSASRKKAQAICQRLIRILKWRSKEGEEYLIFLIRTFRHEDFVIILEDFVHTYHSYLQSTKAGIPKK